jgi:hypothetical protein
MLQELARLLERAIIANSPPKTSTTVVVWIAILFISAATREPTFPFGLFPVLNQD